MGSTMFSLPLTQNFWFPSLGVYRYFIKEKRMSYICLRAINLPSIIEITVTHKCVTNCLIKSIVYIRSCLVPKKFPNKCYSSHHIESCDTCMEH